MTREEAKEIFLNRGFIDGIYDGNKWRESCIVISEWLEQEPILDKIRAEIADYQKEAVYSDDVVMPKRMILGIIDKYKLESEPQKVRKSNDKDN